VVDADFRFIMISAMYENGGNTTQRLLDGHPDLFSYPFESQPGSKYVNDYFTSMFPVKYRWPIFPLNNDLAADYETIIDEECKVRLKTPKSSKFRDYPMDMDDADRKQIFIELMSGQERTRGNLVEAFFRASAIAWKDYNRSGKESFHVGYSPIIVVDADKIVNDYNDSHVLHIVRNPWSAYADTKKRAVPLSLAHYITAWTINQQYALTYADMYPGRVHVLRFEDIVADPVHILGAFLSKIGSGKADTLAKPTWNSQVLNQVYPWGTIRTPTLDANRATADELSNAEKDEIRSRAKHLLGILNYDSYLMPERRVA
jgi:Sulfotransferase family